MDEAEREEELIRRGLTGDTMRAFYQKIGQMEANAKAKAGRCKPGDALYYIWNGKADAYSIIRYELESRMGLQK